MIRYFVRRRSIDGAEYLASALPGAETWFPAPLTGRYGALAFRSRAAAQTIATMIDRSHRTGPTGADDDVSRASVVRVEDPERYRLSDA